MQRREFLNSVSISLAGVCGVCLAGCSKSGASDNNTPSAVNFTVNLNSSLIDVGESIIQSGVIVARIATGNTVSSFTAVQVNCTHEGTAINFNALQNIFICPNHGSRFNTDGTVLLGPATINLKKYTLSINSNILTVTG